MLTKEQYNVLRCYLNGNISIKESELSEIEIYLLDCKYIESAAFSVEHYGQITQVFASSYQITKMGRAALAEYEQKQHDRIFQIWLVILGALLAILAERLAMFFG